MIDFEELTTVGEITYKKNFINVAFTGSILFIFCQISRVGEMCPQSQILSFYLQCAVASQLIVQIHHRSQGLDS